MPDRLQYLFDRHLAGTLTGEERYELMGMALDPVMQEQVKQITGDAWNTLDESEDVSEETKEELLRKLPVTSEPIRMRFNWRRIAVAASLLIAISTAAYFLLINRSKKQDETVNIVTPAKDVKAPEANRAMITLADGRTVYLDSAANGELVQQGNIKIVKLANGQIAYQTASGEIIKELQYNTLSNPRGSKVIDMQLSDGSHVWLNAGSSVTYPVAFVGNERKVTITGEAYFEVAHNSSMPFKVSKGEMELTVLGTHFNVYAYDDEANIKVTLLEGSVKVNSTIIKPGQQAQVSDGVKVVSNVDLEEVMAWKNGRFELNGNTIEPIMRQIARWYDVEVEYIGAKPTANFMGGTSRQDNLSELLKILEQTKAVKFKVEGKKVVVTN